LKIVTDIRQLHKPTKPVEGGEDIDEMVDTLFKGLVGYQEGNLIAVGLSANQLGYDRSIFVMKMDPLPPICMVNPVITKTKGSQVREEGCLSVPGKTVKVKRPYQVTVKGLNRYLRPVKYKMSGFQARVVCHEVDHLNGKLITDYEEVK
jgi:peptide deformylase